MTTKPDSPTTPTQLNAPTPHLINALEPRGDHTFEMRFTSTPRGARLARRLTAVRLDAWGIPYDAAPHDEIVLIVAELTANAVRHGHVPGRDFHLRVHAPADGRTVRVESPTPAPNASLGAPLSRTPLVVKRRAAGCSSCRASPRAGTGTRAQTVRARQSGRSTSSLGEQLLRRTGTGPTRSVGLLADQPVQHALQGLVVAEEAPDRGFLVLGGGQRGPVDRPACLPSSPRKARWVRPLPSRKGCRALMSP
jgi:hypothetical protein